MARPSPQLGTQDDVIFARIVAWVIDAILIAIVSGAVVGGVSVVSGRLGALLGPVFGLLAFVYFIYLEGTYGQTVGKKAMNLVVVDENGGEVDMTASLIRNVLRIVDALPFLYLVGLVLILVTDEKQRLGDIVADTLVVKAA